jgi:UDP-N-acetylmuramoyl-L-alanyl-D-glutamate--2,6-diaminopimelate ligase
MQMLKNFVPARAVIVYHSLIARVAAVRAGRPSRKLLVIGVTGTKGKSTTVAMLAHTLTVLGERVAFSSTVQWGMLGKTWPNRSKMTMPGRGELQRFLQRAVRAGCTAVVLEVSSEGLRQGRHLGIAFDGAVFLNLTPEHIEAHGSFRNYRHAKERVFASLNRSWRKKLNGKSIPTVIAANVDDPNAFHFLRHAADQYVAWSVQGTDVRTLPRLQVMQATDVIADAQGCSFHCGAAVVRFPLLGMHNVSNAMGVVSILQGFGYDISAIGKALSSFTGVPGRMEEVQLNAPFRVFVDYAHEPASLQAAYAAARLLQPKRLLVLLGSQGGGRDVAKRSVMGALAAEHADVVVVTNEDPYDEQPEKIIADVADAAASVGKAIVYRITDRREAILRMLQLAKPGDVLLLTGKGGEEVMAVAGGKLVPWDDRRVIHEEFENLAKRAN